MDWKAFALAVALVVWGGAPQALAARGVDFEGQRASRDARALAEWIGRSGDAAGLPFAIVDKRQARLYVFDASHRLVGASTVLVGQTPGDHTVPGVGERAQAGQVGPDERTTPAGRFESVPGRNLGGEDVVWLDWDAAFAIHRVRDGASLQERLRRLKTRTPADNRVSLGCVVVPENFYLSTVQPVLGHARGVVYVLPESGSLRQLQALVKLQQL